MNSWLPLLFIPTNASPAFIILFFISTYFLNRPCIYCSILLIILFISSCHWSDHCFFDFYSNWFEPRYLSSALPNPAKDVLEGGNDTATSSDQVSFLVSTINQTAVALAEAAVQTIKKRSLDVRPEWTGAWGRVDPKSFGQEGMESPLCRYSYSTLNDHFMFYAFPSNTHSIRMAPLVW